MTNLLKELESVVASIETAESWDCTGDQMRCLDGTGCECAMKGHDHPDAEGDAVNFIRTHHAEIAEAVRDANILRIERDIAREKAERCVQILIGIHALLYPKEYEVNGMTYVFRPLHPNEWMDRLSERIRSIPDEIDTMHNSAREVGE